MSFSRPKRRARLEVERLEDRTAPAGASLAAGPLVVTADFDHNSTPDVVIANPALGEVRVMLGQKDGTFQAPLRFPTGAVGFGALFVGDFNSDGHLDLVGVALNNAVFLLGNGDGTFQAPLLVRAQEDGSSFVPLLGSANHHNGLPPGGIEGAIPTQMGSAGLSLPQTFSRNVPPPTAGARLHSIDELTVPETEEKRKSAELLTSFGIVVCWSGLEGQRPPLADVFVVNGPGLPLGVDLFSPRGAAGNLPEDAPGGNEENCLVQHPSIPLADRVFGGGKIMDEHALNSFRMGLEDAFRANGSGGLPGSTAKTTAVDGPLP